MIRKIEYATMALAMWLVVGLVALEPTKRRLADACQPIPGELSLVLLWPAATIPPERGC